MKGDIVDRISDWLSGNDDDHADQTLSDARAEIMWLRAKVKTAESFSVVAWAVVCGDCVDSTFADRDEAVEWASGLIPPAHIVPLYRRQDAMTLTGNERAAILFAIECLHDQPHTAMHQTVLRSAHDLRGLLDRTE